MAPTPRPLVIFDTTLRDGEQSPGMSMNLEEKLLVADTLDMMGVDVIEAGFAMASEGDFASVKAIAERCKNAVICSLARAKEVDIERAAEAIKPAKRGRIHTFMSTSPIHLEHQFKMDQPQVLDLIARTVAYARNFTDDVEWSAMDATRTPLPFLTQAVSVAIQAGATTINLPDTVGYATPEHIHAMFTHVMQHAHNAENVIFSFHGQNDLGLATANTLAAIRAGAGQAELTINGIGERAGNTSLEEVVMTLKIHAADYNVQIGVDSTHIMRASRLVQSITGQSVQVNKAIVGANAFAHESGIHQDGMLKHAGTYEIMTPESVGLTRSNLVLGKHSGRHALKARFVELGIQLGDNAFEDAFNRFKILADKKKDIYDDDLFALVDSRSNTAAARITLEKLNVRCGSEGQEAELHLLIDGASQQATCSGNGPVDAVFKAIKTLIPVAQEARLQLYQVHAVTAGTDAQAEVTVRLHVGDTIINGHGANVDTLVASAEAYINALLKLDVIRAQKRDITDME